MASSYEFALFSSLRSTFDFSPSACCTTEYSTSCSEPWGFMALKNVALALAKNADAVPTVLFTPMSTLLLLVCRLKRAVLSWSGITGQLLCHLQKLVSWAQLKNPGTAVQRAVGPSLFCRRREENTRAHTHGEILRVMNMIIGPGTVGPCGSARAGRGGEGDGTARAGWPGRGEGARRAARRGEEKRREEDRRGSERGGEGGGGEERSEAERERADPARALLRRSALPGCNGVLFPSAPSAEGSAPQQDLL